MQAFVGALTVFAVSAAALAQPSTDLAKVNQPLKAALNSHFRSLDEARIASELAAGEKLLQSRAINGVEENNAAQIFLQKGIAVDELARRAELLDLDIAEVDVRIAVGERGTVYTFWREVRTGNDLTMRDSLRLAEQSIRDAIVGWPALGEDASASERNERVALKASAPLVIAFVAVGSNSRLASLRRRADVVGIVLLSKERSEPLLAYRAALRNERTFSGRSPMTVDAQDGLAAPARIKAPLGVAPTEYLGEPPSRSGSVVPMIEGPQNCGSAVGGEPCPAVRFWTPGTQTIGSGALIAMDFHISHMYSDNLSDGWSQTSLKWGNTALFLAGWQVGKRDTAAWNSRASRPPTWPACNFVTVGFSMPCAPDQNNVIYVPNGTYEDEVHIPNIGCTLPLRTGLPADRQYGCYVASGYDTNFPTPYLDTPVADSPTVFIAAMGSAEGKNINTSTTYSNKIYFWSNKPVSNSGYTWRHKGQIGTRSPSNCYSTWCVYSTKTATYSTGVTL